MDASAHWNRVSYARPTIRRPRHTQALRKARSIERITNRPRSITTTGCRGLAFMMDWGPIMELPVKSQRGKIRPAIDERGQLDWGAFGTVDFERLREPFDIARYKADMLQAELRHNVLMLETLAGRVPVEAQIRILELGRTGRLDLDDIGDADEWLFARRYLRIKRLRNGIRELRELSYQRRRWSR